MVESAPAGKGGGALHEVVLRPDPAHQRADHGRRSVSLAALGGRGMGVGLMDQRVHGDSVGRCLDGAAHEPWRREDLGDAGGQWLPATRDDP